MINEIDSFIWVNVLGVCFVMIFSKKIIFVKV